MAKTDSTNKILLSAEKKYLKSIELFGGQIQQSYKEAKRIELPKSYSVVNKVVACGMGGSNLGVDLIRHLYSDKIRVPIIQIRNYNLPRFVDNKTLVLLISYSGNTEEIITLFKRAVARKYKIIVIASDGILAKQARAGNVPAYIFDPINNPSGQPRMGTGYIIGSVLTIMKKLKLVDLSEDQIKKMFAKINVEKLKFNVNTIAKKIKDKVPIIVATEFLQGNAHIMANQINESAKQLSAYHFIPELNHHLMEGLAFPKTNKNNFYVLFFFSQNYQQRNKKRYRVTQQVVAQSKFLFSQIEFKGDKISQAMQMLIFGSLLSYRLAKLNRVNPSQTPWVDFFKQRMK